MAHVPTPFARRTLHAAAAFWLAVVVAGQSIFVAYIASFYGRAVLADDWSRWNKVLAAGYVHGDRIGNAALAAHLAIAVVITVAGPLQLLPCLRARWSAVHRWIGRIYIPVAVLTSIAGAYMVWTRKVSGDLPQHLGVTLNAGLIVLCAGMTLYHAMQRRFGAHRQWALRLFMVVSGSWFFRVGLLFWIVVNGRPVGFDPDAFVGPALSILTFMESLLPLAVLEAYLRAHKGRPWKRFATAGLLVVLTIGVGVGSAAAAVGMWLPHI